MAGLLECLLGKAPSTKYDIETAQKQGLKSFFESYYDIQGMANQRMGVGLKPLDWPRMINNQLTAIALTRPLTEVEKLLQKGAQTTLNVK